MKNLKKYYPSALAVFFALVTIYPTGCFSWQSPFNTVTQSITLDAKKLSESLNCVKSKPNLSETERLKTEELLVKITEALKNTAVTFSLSLTEFQEFQSKYPDCNFPLGT